MTTLFFAKRRGISHRLPWGTQPALEFSLANQRRSLSRFFCVQPGRVLSLGLTVLVLGGCGRPATESECREIMHSAARLELQERLGSAQLIEEELQAIEKSMEKPMMEKCVGKPITDSKMACIRKAKTTAELFDGCF